MLDLDTLNSNAGDYQITTTVDANMMASATLILSNDAVVGAQVICRLEISDGTGPTNGLTPMGAGTGATVSMLSGGIAASYFATVPLIGAARLPPGTYNVRATCNSVLVPPCPVCVRPQFRNGHLNVWAVGN